MFSIDLEPLVRRLKSIERKLDRLMEHAGIEEPPIPEVSRGAYAKIMSFILDNKKIPAIKEYRGATGAGLKHAKSVIDSLYQ